MKGISNKKLIIPIGEAAKLLGVNAVTLRRKEEKGIISSVRNVPRGKRYFFRADILNLKYDVYELAKEWVRPGKVSVKKFQEFFYPLEANLNGQVTIVARERLQGVLSDDYISVVIGAASELANNIFYHNQGQWPDVEGAFYVLDVEGRRMIMADRGVGLLKNLQLVEPALHTDAEALDLAFTKQISSRPGHGRRGFGLKMARKCVERYLKRLIFQTGNARLEIRAGDENIYIDEVSNPIQGCLAVLEF